MIATADGANLWRFINGLPDVLLWQAEEDGALSFVSDGLAALLGKTAAQLIQDPAVWRDRVYPGHRRAYHRAVQSARESHAYTDFEYRARLPGLGVIWLRDHIIADPHTGALYGITTQISEHHDTTERLAFLNKAARLFAATMDSTQLLGQLGDLIAGSLANVCIIELLHPDGVLVVVRTDSGKRLKTALEARGPLILDGRPLPVRLKQGRATLYQTLTPRRLRGLFGPERMASFGSRPPHAAIIAPLMVRRQLLGAVTFLCTDADRDYTARDLDLVRDVCSQAAIALDHARLFEDAAVEQAKLSTENEMKDEFLALMSHELRAPLTVIYGVSRVLPRLLPPLDPDSTELVEDLYAASERTVHLIDDLMLLARLNLGESPELEAVPVSPLLNDVADDFHRQYPARTLEVSNAAGAGPVHASPPYVRQVLLNLLSNAHKYSPINRPIQLRASGGPDCVTFTVTDSGKGVPNDELDHLFDRFYRASTSEGVSGSGMGLAICKRLVGALNGRIWAENQKPYGLAVSFDLPAYPER